jgi:excisionase family DNA binding protein
MKSHLHEPTIISVTEAARRAGITDRHVRRLIRDGVIQATRIGRAWLVDAESVAAYQRHPTMGRPRATKPKRAARKR